MTLTDSPITLVRSLRGAPLACLFILLLDGQALRSGALCQATGYSPNSITAALRLLADLNLIEKAPDGWRVPAHLRETLLTRNGSQATVANRAAPPSNRESIPPGGGESASDSWRVIPPPPEVTQPSQLLNPQPDPQSTRAAADNCPPPTGVNPAPDTLPAALDVSRILDATRLLFGERLHGPPSRYPDMRLLLAAIAEAYVRRQSLRKPARVAYANLKHGVDPGSEFLANPLIHLPDSFLSAVGLSPHAGGLSPHAGELPLVSSAEGILSDDDAQFAPDAQEDPRPEPHPSLAMPADVQGRRNAAQVWEIAQETMRYELPRPIFNARLEACILASYDPAAALFTVAVPDEQARLWLQDRLSAKLSRLLTGICDRPSSVCFTVVA